MPIFDLFSKRQKRISGNVPDVYQYEEIPDSLRVQIVHIWKDVLGDDSGYNTSGARHAYKFVHDALCREYGRFQLKERARDDFDSVAGFLLETEKVETAIDVIELSVKYIDVIVRERPYNHAGTKLSPDEAIAELNARFREHGVGYQYESGQMIRVDSQLIHREVVQPALRILTAKMYQGANQEFLSAHSHHREGKHKECLADCLKALESTIKAICDRRKWRYESRDTAKTLIAVVFKQGLVPQFMQTHFSGLRSTLESGVPTLRNKLGGHGQGTVPISVPDSIASWALHLTAASIVFLAKADGELK